MSGVEIRTAKRTAGWTGAGVGLLMLVCGLLWNVDCRAQSGRGSSSATAPRSTNRVMTANAAVPAPVGAPQSRVIPTQGVATPQNRSNVPPPPAPMPPFGPGRGATLGEGVDINSPPGGLMDPRMQGDPRAMPMPDPGAMGVMPPQMPGPLPIGPVLPGPPGPRMRDLSWIYIELPPPRTVKVHDILTVVVNENSEMTQDSRFDRQRNAQFKAQLRQFIRIDSDGRLKPAAKDSPTIDGQLRSQLQSNGVARTREGLKYRIAATVVDVLPNGTVILEARKTIRTNNDFWEYSLTGRVRTEDIQGNNTIMSENIADLNISKQERGKVYDSTKRGIFMYLYDKLLPF